ncbi:lanthionine synthetase C family protein [Streptomyces sp. P9-2B-2]|uniref:lanthionine synthetase C family protein n=1 Tax=Streptomyces TaxID=1883 RepID=UPI0022524679|nr:MULTISPECIES: lanthionine synthetase C family protein [Streptomyces]MCX4635709.1 lanthionine synthetase C family protein [Streptomyces platensis]WJY42082.1 lanthionine synthetase C family protein [Streptomyces sp. P9-2B-2]
MTAPLALCDAASDLAYRVADLLSSPEQVAGTAHEAFTALPPELWQPAWQPASLLMGHPGIALLHTRCARNDARYAAIGHAHLAVAVAATTDAGPAAVGDLLLPARLHADAHGGYARLLARCAEVHAAYVRARVARLAARQQEHGPGLAADDYDVISGLAGDARGLLLAADHGDERCAQALRDVLAYLVRMTHPVRSPVAGGSPVPGWWCAPDRYLLPRDREEYPRGDLNVGVAHGICGPLALMALAYRAGHRVPGMADALRRMADWAVSVGYTDHLGMRWPGRVAATEAAGESSHPPQELRPPWEAGARSRPGWCYGTAGIAWSLYLAGRALSDGQLTALAEDAVGGLVRRPLDAAVSTDPGFCHGRAGVLHTVSRMAVATGRTEWWAMADDLAQELVAEYDPRTPFGFRQVVPPAPGSVSATHRVHHPGLLDGAAGIALVLVDYADARRGGGVDEVNGWDAAFLMG